MAFRDLLVCVDPTTAGEIRLNLAFDLARAGKAHLAAAYALPVERRAPPDPRLAGLPPIPSDGLIGAVAGGLGGGGGAAGHEPGEAALEESVELRFRAELGQHGLDGDWQLYDAGDVAVVIELAKSADLTILGQVSPDLRTGGVLRPEDVVVATGRPVLVVPYAGVFPTVGKRAVIAWDGTREAARAVGDALPLLAGAEAVTVMFVGAQEAALERLKPSLERVVAHLRRHGIAARVEETVRGELAVSDVLLSRAADLAADLIVAGAYHHSQLREALVGGVSRELLEHMTVPVLLSH
jgi:nucleotide-binding universal stress UspA family protein